MLTIQNALVYLENQLQTWQYIGTAEQGLYATYKSNQKRCDSYDNSLLVNALLMLQPSEPHPIILKILNFFYGSYQYILNNSDIQLIAAAYTVDDQNNIDICNEDCDAQDVGNNSLILIAVAKFCHIFPNHEMTPNFLTMIEFFISKINEIKKTCPNLNIVGYARRTNKESISTEHMIDLYALSNICLALPLNEVTMGILQEMNENTRLFVIAMWIPNENRYLIGTSETCDLNMSSPQPVDTITWNILANADENEERSTLALQYVCANFITVDPPGIKFSIDATCPQYENTGSFLCSLKAYELQYNKIFTCIGIDKMFTFLLEQINTNKPIQGAYNANCETGLGWSYYTDGHLASTIYCLLAVTDDPFLNIYQLTTFEDLPSLVDCLEEKNEILYLQKKSSKFKILTIVGFVIACILGILLLLFIFSRRFVKKN